MTVTGLSDFIRKRGVPFLGREKNSDDIPFYLNQLNGMKVAIDTSSIVYKQNWAAINEAIRKHTFFQIEENGQIQWSRPAEEEVLKYFKIYFKSYVTKLVASGIIPIFVLEGKSPDLKINTVQKRSKTKNENKEAVNTLSLLTDLESYKEKLHYFYVPGYSHMQIVIDILKSMKITTLRAKHEAEGVCAYLVNNKKVSHHCDCALSDDHDIFMYGCRVIIRNLRNANAQVGYFEAIGYSFQDVLYAMDFLKPSQSHTYDEYQKAKNKFRMLCIMCGTDYADNVSGIGPVKAHALIQEHNLETWEDLCKIDERYKSIPYNEIIKTLEENMEYTVIYSEDTKSTSESQVDTPNIST